MCGGKYFTPHIATTYDWLGEISLINLSEITASSINRDSQSSSSVLAGLP